MHAIVTSGTWPAVHEADGNDVRDLGTDYVKWGNYDDALSGYEFQGGTTEVKLDGSEFVLGTFTHHNKGITGGLPTHQFKVDLAVDIAFEDQIQETFPFTFGHFETGPGEGPNGSEDDVVNLEMFVSKNTVRIDGNRYKVILSGFKQNGHITRRFVSPEGSTNSADVVAMFIKVGGKPRLEADVNRQGVNPGESDEYVELRNVGDAPLDLAGYTVSGPNTDKKFTFPAGSKLEAGDRVRVYTNETHPESGGYSFNSPEPIWLNADEGEELVQIRPPH
jgi:hypothetical protein